jgi:hypothetical protein
MQDNVHLKQLLSCLSKNPTSSIFYHAINVFRHKFETQNWLLKLVLSVLKCHVVKRLEIVLSIWLVFSCFETPLDTYGTFFYFSYINAGYVNLRQRTWANYSMENRTSVLTENEIYYVHGIRRVFLTLMSVHPITQPPWWRE